MGHIDETEGRAWASAWATSIGRNISSVRKARGIGAAQQLADRCAALGYPIPRSTIANIESGRKRDVPVQEVAVIARALGVPPVRLLYPLQDGGLSFTALPDVEVLPVDAMEWFSGRARIDEEGLVSVLTNDGTDAGLSNARTERDNRLAALHMVEQLEELRHQLADAQAGILPPWVRPEDRVDHLELVGGPTDAEFAVEQIQASITRYERALYHALGDLRQARAGMRVAGMTVPMLPDSLVSWIQSVGGDPAGDA